MIKLRVSLGKIHQLKGQQLQPQSWGCLTDTVEGTGKAFSHIRPLRCRGQAGDEKKVEWHVKSRVTNTKISGKNGKRRGRELPVPLCCPRLFNEIHPTRLLFRLR